MKEYSHKSKAVLVVSFSNIVKDPRVRRQVEWLLSDGWDVSTLGLGDEAVQDTTHYQLLQKPIPKLIRGLVLLLFPASIRFKIFVTRGIPKQLDSYLDSFSAIVVNEIDLLPWVEQVIRTHSNLTFRHLDLHEYHQFEAPKNVPRFLIKKLESAHAWMFSLIGKIDFTSYSTVAPGIASLYESEFKIPNFELVLNSRPYFDLTPSEINPESIELLYHGNAQADRGLSLLLEAATNFDSRYKLNLMLTGDPLEIDYLMNYSKTLGINPTWIDPVPMDSVPLEINQFDIEIIFYPPKSPNLLYSYPNKFFEAIQGRLAVITGKSPSMADQIVKYGIGFIVEGWNASDLSEFVNSLSIEELKSAKLNTQAAAAEIVTSNDKKAFLKNFSLEF